MTAPTVVTIGLDVSDRVTHACVLDHEGRCLEERRVRTTRQRLAACLHRYPQARTVLEAGPHSPWISRLLEGMGHDVVVANSRRARTSS